MKDKELWMDKLKEKLQDYSEPVPASGWEQLEKELIPPVKKIYPYRRWSVAVAAAVAMLLISSVSLYFLRTPAADEVRHTALPAVASVPDVLPKGISEPAVPSPQVIPVVRAMVPGKEQRLAKAERRERELPQEQIEAEQKEQSMTAGKEVVEVKKEEAGSEEPLQNVRRPRRPSGKDKLHIPSRKKSAGKGKWSMGLAVGNSGGASGGAGDMDMSRVNMLSVSSGVMQIPNDQSLIFSGGVPYLRKAKEALDMEHHQPVSVGLSVRKSLRRGFSLETGLTYTLLSSDVKMENEHKIEQKLHYLGIPLRVNWNFLDKRLFTLYVSGGGMVEKCVYGKLDGEKLTVNPLQFSVSGAVGAQVNATKHVGVYVEPGVAYFFDDGSRVQTIRKENPFNFNIQGGVRFTY